MRAVRSGRSKRSAAIPRWLMRDNRNANRADAARSGCAGPRRGSAISRLKSAGTWGRRRKRPSAYDNSGDQAGSEAKLGVGTRC